MLEQQWQTINSRLRALALPCLDSLTSIWPSLGLQIAVGRREDVKGIAKAKFRLLQIGASSVDFIRAGAPSLEVVIASFFREVDESVGDDISRIVTCWFNFASGSEADVRALEFAWTVALSRLVHDDAEADKARRFLGDSTERIRASVARKVLPLILHSRNGVVDSCRKLLAEEPARFRADHDLFDQFMSGLDTDYSSSGLLIFADALSLRIALLRGWNQLTPGDKQDLMPWFEDYLSREPSHPVRAALLEPLPPELLG